VQILPWQIADQTVESAEVTGTRDKLSVEAGQWWLK
jgi:hypothetical protein